MLSSNLGIESKLVLPVELDRHSFLFSKNPSQLGANYLNSSSDSWICGLNSVTALYPPVNLLILSITNQCLETLLGIHNCKIWPFLWWKWPGPQRWMKQSENWIISKLFNNNSSRRAYPHLSEFGEEFVNIINDRDFAISYLKLWHW